MTKLNTLILTALFATLSQAALSAEPAKAQAAYDPAHLVVRFGDLDVTRPAGVKVLFSRIKAAAESVCSPFERSTLASYMVFKKCVAEAIGTAVTQVDRPRLTAYYSEKVQGRHAERIEVASSNEHQAR